MQRKEHSELAGTGQRRPARASKQPGEALPMTVNSVPAGSGRRREPC